MVLVVHFGRRCVASLCLLAALLCLPSFALAQAAAPPPPPPLREGSVDFSLLVTTGNASTNTVGLGGNIIYRPGPWVIENRAAFVRTETDDIVNAERFLYLFRAARTITPRLSAYGEYGFFRDPPAGVEHRNTVIGGLDYLLVDVAPHRLNAFGGLGYANEHRTSLVPPPPEDISTAILNAGWKYKLTLSENADFTDDFRYETSLSDSDDWRIAHVAAVSAKLTTLLSLKASATLRYVNFPPTGLKKTDTTTSIALVAKF